MHAFAELTIDATSDASITKQKLRNAGVRLRHEKISSYQTRRAAPRFNDDTATMTASVMPSPV